MTKAFKENDMQDQIVKAEFFLPMRGTYCIFQCSAMTSARSPWGRQNILAAAPRRR